MIPAHKVQSVMVVDDTPMNIQLLVNALQDTYRMRVANGGRQALAIAGSDDPPDLILLDIMMPEMDGYEVCRRLKQNPQTMHIPVIFVTTRSDPEDEAFGMNLGAMDYISKPFSIPVVKARIRTHLQFKQRSDMLETLAMIDSLTGIANRRSLDQTLEREHLRGLRCAGPLGLMMIDIDNFKAYNDHYGHGAGDECLRQVAQTLESSLQRPGDFVGRYGGEEFVVILPDCDAAGLLMVADNIRLQVAALNIPHAFSGTADHVTVSIGCKSFVCAEGATSDALLHEVDQALYLAKEQGRNRVVVAE